MCIRLALATPYGMSITKYYTALIGNGVVAQHIVEWAPPSFRNPFSIAFIVLLLLTCGVLGYGLGRGHRPPWSQLWLLGVTSLLAMSGLRYQIWFGISAALVCAELLARLRPLPHPLHRRALVLGATTIAAPTGSPCRSPMT